MKKPSGALSRKQFDKIAVNKYVWLVWSTGELEKRRKDTLSPLTEESDWDKRGEWRRAFTNYFHAYAHSLRIKRNISGMFPL